jgi:hypothetical protein
MGALQPIVVGQTMFDAIPFSNVTDNNQPVKTDQSNIMSATPPKSIVDGTYELLYSSGKVAADAALASVRSIWSVLSGPATAAFDKVANNIMDPLAKPAGPADMTRAGAGGGSIIDKWSGIIADDVKLAGDKIQSGISTVGAEVKKDATSGLQYVTGGVQNTLNWAGKVTGSTIGSIFSGLGIGGTSVILLIVAGVVVFFLYPYAAPTLAARAARS